MILFRYLTREVLLTMSAVAGILLLVIMGSRFIRYFSDAAEGDFPVNILGSLMVYHLPGFMELILPLAFFLGILLAYGQLYMNSEITVMVACGISPTTVAGNVAACNGGGGVGWPVQPLADAGRGIANRRHYRRTGEPVGRFGAGTRSLSGIWRWAYRLYQWF